jgi:hypothetical protein
MKIDKRSKMGRFVQHVMPGVVRPLRGLWHEISGFIFIVLAVIFGSSAFRNFRLIHEEISILAGGVVFPPAPDGVFRDHFFFASPQNLAFMSNS